MRSPSNARSVLSVAALAAFVRQPQREVEGIVLDRKIAGLEPRPQRRAARLTSARLLRGLRIA
jgi:hypothetical protein